VCVCRMALLMLSRSNKWRSKQQTFIFENGEQQTCMATCHGVMTWQQLTSIDLYIVVVLYLHCDRYFVCRD
jgi:hypothetical protein